MHHESFKQIPLRKWGFDGQRYMYTLELVVTERPRPWHSLTCSFWTCFGSRLQYGKLARNVIFCDKVDIVETLFWNLLRSFLCCCCCQCCCCDGQYGGDHFPDVVGTSQFCCCCHAVRNPGRPLTYITHASLICSSLAATCTSLMNPSRLSIGDGVWSAACSCRFRCEGFGGPKGSSPNWSCVYALLEQHWPMLRV